MVTFLNDKNPFYKTFHDLSHYNLNLQNADFETRGVWHELRRIMWKTDGCLVDRWDRKIEDEDAAAALQIPIEKFKHSIRFLEGAKIFGRNEKGILYDPFHIEDMEEQKNRRAKNNERQDDHRKKKRKNSDGVTVRNCDKPLQVVTSCDNRPVTPKSRVEEGKRREEDSKAIYKRESRVEGSTAPGEDNPPPVDNSAHSDSLTYQDSSYRSEIEALANLIETTTTAGECNGIGESERRQAIYYQSEVFPASDSAVWFNAMTEAISCAQPGTRQHELLTAFRKYPDGILDSGNVSRSEELIRLTAQKPNCGACSKALAYIHGKQGKTTPPPSNSPGNEDDMPF